MINEAEKALKNVLIEIDQNWGGDVRFFPPIKKEYILDFEKRIGWKLPGIFQYFYMNEANGILIDNKQIYGFHDIELKNNLVENLERVNNPGTSPWFKNKPEVFNDYVVIGCDSNIVFCLSKKYDLFNPSVYISKNANSSKHVDLVKIDMDLSSLIQQMVVEAYEA